MNTDWLYAILIVLVVVGITLVVGITFLVQDAQEIPREACQQQFLASLQPANPNFVITPAKLNILNATVFEDVVFPAEHKGLDTVGHMATRGYEFRWDTHPNHKEIHTTISLYEQPQHVHLSGAIHITEQPDGTRVSEVVAHGDVDNTHQIYVWHESFVYNIKTKGIYSGQEALLQLAANILLTELRSACQ